MNVSLRPGIVIRMAILAIVLPMVLAACISSSGDDPTATPEPTATQVAEAPTATPTEEPTATPEPTPLPTETPFRPAPTVAVPRHQIPPTPIPAPTSTPVPTEVPAEEGGDGPVLVYSGTLTDWGSGEIDTGSGFPTEAGYHLVNGSPNGVAIWNGLTDIFLFDLVASVDLRMLSQGAGGYGCLAVRTELDTMSYAYALCLNGANQAVADFTYLDDEGFRNWDVLIDFTSGEFMAPVSEWNTLTIAAVQTGFAFYVNDEMVGSLEHEGPLSGAISIFSYNFDETPSEWVFTNLEIWSAD